MHEEYLLTTAEVAGALLGFVGVVLILNRRAEGVVSRQDQSGLFHLVYAAAGAMFFSLVMYAVLASAQSHGVIWRVGLVLITIHITYGVTTAIMEGQEDENRLNPVARHLLSAATFALIAFNICVIVGFFQSYASLAYALSVTLMIGVAVSYFVPFVLLRSHQPGSSEGNEPDA